MSRLLLDTQTIIWWDSASANLGEIARGLILGADSVYVSAVSEWELAIKSSLGKIAVRRSILDATLAAGFEPLPVTFEHARNVRSLNPIHNDPFDRLLVSVASVEALTLVSSDLILERYPVTFLDASR